MARSREQKCPQCGYVIPNDAGDGFFEIRATLSNEVKDLWETVSERLRSQGTGTHPSPRMSAGQILEALLSEFMAGPFA